MRFQRICSPLRKMAHLARSAVHLGASAKRANRLGSLPCPPMTGTRRHPRGSGDGSTSECVPERALGRCEVHAAAACLVLQLARRGNREPERAGVAESATRNREDQNRAGRDDLEPGEPAATAAGCPLRASPLGSTGCPRVSVVLVARLESSALACGEGHVFRVELIGPGQAGVLPAVLQRTDRRPRGPNQPRNAIVGRRAPEPSIASATGSMRTRVRLAMA